jgi:hypothetical protein
MQELSFDNGRALVAELLQGASPRRSSKTRGGDMQDALKRGLRIVGLAVMALAIAHCGDNDNFDNDNDDGGPRPTTTGAVRTATPPGPAVTPTPGDGPTATSDGGVTPTGGDGATPTVEPTTDGNACPSAISFLGNEQTTSLDTGWTGLAHGSRIISGGEVTVSTDCGGNPRPCGVCNLTGPIANPDTGQGISNNRRCTGNSATECTGDGDCGGSGTCAFFFGPPLPLAAGGVSTCVTNQVVGNVTGTANIETGESASTVNLVSRVFTGPTLDTPCPVCSGDSTPGDGQKNGTCSDGANAGQPCDIAGTSPTFDPNGSTSFDCPPLSGGQIGALPINLSNTTGTVTRTLSDASPNCRAAAGKKCQCDTCATLAAEPCSTNADCPGGAACGGLRCRGGGNNGNACTTSGTSTECPGGACGVPGQASAPNACDDPGTCSPSGASSTTGECAAGPFEQFCSPKQTFRSCTADTDCPISGDTCSLGKNRPCFLDNGDVGSSVTATGVADPPENGVANPTLASLFCIPPTSSSAVNSAAGLPGLGRIQLTGTATERP